MVKIIDLTQDLMNEEDADSTDEASTDEQDDEIEFDMEETPLKPTDPSAPPLFPDAYSALEPSDAETGAGLSLAPEDIRQLTFAAGISLPSFYDMYVRPAWYLWDVMAQYNLYVESLQRSLHCYGPMRPSGPVDLSSWAFELQHLAVPPNDPVFSYIITPTQTCVILPTATGSDRKIETEFAAGIPSTASHDEAVGREACKTDNDESTMEKSNGAGEKIKLAGTAIAVPISSYDLSDYDLSDVSDFHAPPDYETLQVELNANNKRIREVEYTSTSSTERSWTTVRECYAIDVDPESTNSTDGQEPPEYSEEDEAACLPADSIAKDCWEQWVDDDTLFKLAEEIPAPSTSAGGREPSPPSPGTERRRVKFENRQRAREREPKAKPVEREIFVPTMKVGRILGKRGRQIREIERITGANIKVEHHRSNKPVTRLTITGTNEQISKADEEICIIIRNFKPPKSGKAATTSVSQEEKDLKQVLIGIKNQVIDAEKRCRKP